MCSINCLLTETAFWFYTWRKINVRSAKWQEQRKQLKTDPTQLGYERGQTKCTVTYCFLDKSHIACKTCATHNTSIINN